MSLTRIISNTPDSAQSVRDHLNSQATSKMQSKLNIANWFSGMSMGVYPDATAVAIETGGVQASGTGTFTGIATADQEMVIVGVTFTAKASPNEALNQYKLSATVAVEAASLARAINASVELAGVVTATAALGVVTITAVNPGISGNFLPTVDTNTSNFTFAQALLAGGVNGTTVVL